MNRLLFATLFCATATPLLAQTAYTNAELSSTSDVIGTARYVGMGGALGALGADISAISSNPAAIGLYRRADVALTAGGLWQKNKQYKEDNTGRGTFDQFGIVGAWKIDAPKVRYFNVGFNYQKKYNFFNAYYADNDTPGGLSQADMMADLANKFYNEDTFDKTLYGAMYNAWIYDNDEQGFYNGVGADKNRFSSYTTGSVQAFDINFSTNVLDRYYLGLTIGIDNVEYNRFTEYTEERTFNETIQDYTLASEHHISGYGVNVKLGAIVRPFEDSPFRVGLTVETPTWYKLKSTVFYDIYSKYDKDGNYIQDGYSMLHSADDNYLEYNLRTPWRARVSMGSTIDRFFAWGLEYEYANYGKNHMSYPGYDTWDGFSASSTPDREMNKLNRRTFQGQHTVKAGAELNLTDRLALRLGYNYITTPYKKNARLQQDIDSYAMDYVAGTAYSNLSDVNIITCGLGYRYKKFYVDLAYRFRQQRADVYAFDDSFTSNADFVRDNPTLANKTLDPVDVNLNRHSITCTLGFKF